MRGAIVKQSVLVYERYFTYPLKPWLVLDATVRHEGNSMTKTVTSLLFGIAVDRGLIKDLDASVFSFFPEYTYLRAPENQAANDRCPFFPSGHSQG